MPRDERSYDDNAVTTTDTRSGVSNQRSIKTLLRKRDGSSSNQAHSPSSNRDPGKHTLLGIFKRDKHETKSGRDTGKQCERMQSVYSDATSRGNASAPNTTRSTGGSSHAAKTGTDESEDQQPGSVHPGDWSPLNAKPQATFTLFGTALHPVTDGQNTDQDSDRNGEE